MTNIKPDSAKKKAQKFMHLANKNNCMIAGEIATKIKEMLYSYKGKIPLVLAVGVLEIVKKEIIDETNNAV